MKVKFVPQNIEVEVTPDKTLLQIATENHIEIKSICKGVPSCAECRVRITDGDQNVVPPGKPELSLIGTSYYIDGRRLSCQVHCFGDVTVDLTEQLERAENQTKKVRGFRTAKHVESRAIQDTMILNEKIESEKPQAPQPHPHHHSHSQGQEPPPPQHQQRQGGRNRQQKQNKSRGDKR